MGLCFTCWKSPRESRDSPVHPSGHSDRTMLSILGQHCATSGGPKGKEGGRAGTLRPDVLVSSQQKTQTEGGETLQR